LNHSLNPHQRGPVQDGYDALAAIVLMIENVIGVHISEWRKNIDWLLPDVEEMTLGRVIVRGNPFGLMMKKMGSRWMVHINCEKEYMVTINAVGIERRTLRSLYGSCAIPL